MGYFFTQKVFFTHPLVVPNWYYYVSSVKSPKKRSFEKMSQMFSVHTVKVNEVLFLDLFDFLLYGQKQKKHSSSISLSLILRGPIVINFENVYPCHLDHLSVFPQGMYVFMHAVKGTPFETPDQGKARLLTHWEQLDYGVQFTSSRKFFTISPIIL